jgi:hypothetical protein
VLFESWRDPKSPVQVQELVSQLCSDPTSSQFNSPKLNLPKLNLPITPTPEH